MDSQKKYSNNHGRKPKTDKMRHRYVFRLSDEDNARFLALFDESGKATRAEFIVSALFGREIKVVKLDKGTQDFYMRLTSFHSQFRSIGVNYNQCVRALKSNFSEKKALAFLYKLEQHTLDWWNLANRFPHWRKSFKPDTPSDDSQDFTRRQPVRGCLPTTNQGGRTSCGRAFRQPDYRTAGRQSLYDRAYFPFVRGLPDRQPQDRETHPAHLAQSRSERLRE